MCNQLNQLTRLSHLIIVIIFQIYSELSSVEMAKGLEYFFARGRFGTRTVEESRLDSQNVKFYQYAGAYALTRGVCRVSYQRDACMRADLHILIYRSKLMDYVGSDQWGSIIGQITFKDSTANTLYLRGFRQRRWGKHESYQFHQIVTLFGITAVGAMYYLGVSRTKNSFSQ